MAAKTLRDAILPALDQIRSIGGILGFRRFTVTVRVRSWSGERPGVGVVFEKNVVLTNQGIGSTPTVPVRVRQLSAKDIIASGGLYRDRDMKVGPMTPTYAASLGLRAGGYDDSTLDVPTTYSPNEIFWNVTGDGMPFGGVWCDKIGEEATALHYFVILRATGRQP